MIGERLGPHEITAKLGEGGMGEVWRATDSRLRREVAIKVLPPAFTADRERLARFEREAQTLAALNHPNIAAIYGLEESNGTRALVMELVEGEDLAVRTARGPLLLEEALPIARQIAEALEAAHEQGIVHRDLKPANVKVRPDGTVKVLDFGLAKAMEPATGDRSRPDLAHSPTLTAAHGTQLGVILGTAAYMAPEQARGGSVDKRTDIWAFGVVLFEMLTGRPLFAGETVSDTLAGVLKTEVDFTTLPAATPAEVRRLLRRCLERNPKRRLHDIADARLMLEEVAVGGDDAPVVPAPTGGAGRAAWLAVAAALVAGLALGALGWMLLTKRSGAELVGFERLTFRQGHFINARFAPDGQTLFLSGAWEGNRPEIFQVRPRSGELPIGLSGAELLSVSRSGELAVLLPRLETGNPYWKAGTLAVVSASGGTPRELADGVVAADWAPDGKSLAVLRLSGGGYRLEYPLGTPLYEAPRRLPWLRVSPDGSGVAFFEPEPSGGWSVVHVSTTGEREVLSSGWSDWWNLAWSPGGEEVWFGAARAGVAASLYAVDRRGALRALLAAPGTIEIHDVAPDGTVAAALVHNRNHVRGGLASEVSGRDLSWLEQSIAAALSSDGKHVLLESSSEREQGGSAAYLRSLDGAPPVRLGPGSPQDLSRDGRRALAIRDRSLVSMPIGPGEEAVLETDLDPVVAARWMPDGRGVLVVGARADGRVEARVVASFGGGATRVVSESLELRLGGSLYRGISPVSPDGRWVAATLARGAVGLVPLDGGEMQILPGSGPNDVPVEWSEDGRRLLVYDPSRLPARLEEVDLASGRREAWREIAPVDRVGVHGVYNVMATPDRKAWACSYLQYQSTLYLVKGLH